MESEKKQELVIDGNSFYEIDLKCLEEIQEKQKEVLEHYDITRFIQLDREFHTYIYQMSQNRELLKLLSNYYDMFRFMGMQAVRGTDKRRQTTIDEHQGILDALKQKNVTLRRYEKQNALVITNSQYRLLRVTSVDFFADLR